MTYKIFRRPLAPASADIDTESQRMAEIGRLSASFIHEISSPLASAMLQLEQHKDNASASLHSALTSMRMLKRYVDALRQQIRSESSAVVFSVNHQLADIKRIITPIAKSAGVKIKFETYNSARMYGDPVKFQQIVANTMLNAIQAYDDYNPPGQKIVTLTCYSCKHHLHLKIQDWGKGIDSSNLTKIFSNFFSTKKEANQGLGMGLFIVRQHVCGYFKGTVTVKSTKRSGTQFFIKLPLKIKQ